MGYTLSRPELDAAYRRFSELADRKKRIYDQDLISFISAELDVPTAVANREQLAHIAAA